MVRLRATFLLRTVVLLAAVAIVVVTWWLFNSLGFTLVTFAVCIVLWLLGIELGLFPLLIERLAASQAQRRGPGDTIWFVDVDAEERRRQERFADDTSDNPTIR